MASTCRATASAPTTNRFARTGSPPLVRAMPGEPDLGPALRYPPCLIAADRGVQLAYLLARHRGFPLANCVGCTPRSTDRCPARRARTSPRQVTMACLSGSDRPLTAQLHFTARPPDSSDRDQRPNAESRNTLHLPRVGSDGRRSFMSFKSKARFIDFPAIALIAAIIIVPAVIGLAI
jgi:hypothetical protein